MLLEGVLFESVDQLGDYIVFSLMLLIRLFFQMMANCFNAIISKPPVNWWLSNFIELPLVTKRIE